MLVYQRVLDVFFSFFPSKIHVWTGKSRFFLSCLAPNKSMRPRKSTRNALPSLPPAPGKTVAWSSWWRPTRTAACRASSARCARCRRPGRRHCRTMHRWKNRSWAEIGWKSDGWYEFYIGVKWGKLYFCWIWIFFFGFWWMGWYETGFWIGEMVIFSRNL